MQSEAERDALQGLESEIFKLVSYSAAPEQWAAWLKEPLKHALAGGGSAEMVDALRGASGLVRGDECKSYIHPYPKRACLQGFERDLFKLLSCAQAPEERAGWLRMPLEHAAACGNLELVDALLGAGANGGAGWRGCRGRTLLDAAALGGNADVVSALVGAGAGPDLNVSSVSSKRSALYTATFCGHEAAARRLVQAGADVNFQDPLDRLNVLHVAVEGGLDQLVKDLLLGGADVHVRDGDRGLTPVHIAAWAGHDRVLSTLFLLNGGDADARHKEHGICQISPMMMAAARGRLSTVHALLAAGASVDTAGNKLRTPLIQATIGGHLPVVEALLAAGADVRFRSVFDRRAAVHYAAEQGYAEIVSALLVGGAYKDPIGRGGVSPLSLATMNGHLTVVEILLAFGADLEVRNTAGETPLHVAAKGVHEGILATLLCAGAHKNALDNHGMSPLTCAAKEGHVGEALLAAGSNLSFRRKGVPRYNALDWAVDRGDVHVVEALIGRGANVDAYYRGGLAALHVAAWKGHAGAAEALIKAGANFELKSGHKASTPLLCAANRGSYGVMFVLLEHGAEVSVRNTGGDTPLHLVCGDPQKGLEAVVGRLLLWGADETLQNNLGHSPVDILDPSNTNGIILNCRRSEEEMDAVRLLVARAPANRAWRRRCWLVMLRSRARDDAACAAAGADGSRGGEQEDGLSRAVSTLLRLASEDVFRATVAFL